MGQRYPVPPPAGSYVPADLAAKAVTFTGGAIGDDVAVSTANCTNDFTPRHQTDKPFTGVAQDVGRARGPIAANQPYPVLADTPPQPPTISSLSPSTAVTGPGKPTVAVLIAGTNFTPWSSVTSGNFPIPSRCLSPTTLEIIQKPSASVPGTVAVVVTDHGIASAPSNFVFT
jgi:hypothetical protein